jgi:hypothetical protein
MRHGSGIAQSVWQKAFRMDDGRSVPAQATDISLLYGAQNGPRARLASFRNGNRSSLSEGKAAEE